MKTLLIILALLILILPLTFSNHIVVEQYLTENFTSQNNVTIILRSKDITLTLNKEILNLKILEAQEKVNCNLFEKYTIFCKIINETYLPAMFKIYFETEKITNEINKYEVKILTKADRFFFYIFLPIGYIVKEEKEEIPNNATLLSDGKRIVLFFRQENITLFETNFTIIKPVEEKLKERVIQPPLSIIILVIIVALIAVVIIYLYYKGKLEKFKKKVIEVLDENERKVLEILMQSKTISQKKLVELTQLSKAEISKIVASLKQRNIIEVEKRGRNNILHLKKLF